MPADHVLYVLKMYPRFSETFILGELLAHQEAGLHLSVASLRRPDDGRFHAELAQLRAPVTYLDAQPPCASALWAAMAEGAAQLPRMPDVLPDLLAAAARDAYQAVLLARQVVATGVTTLHAHFGSVATTVARLASLLTGVPYTFTAHAKDIFHEGVVEVDLARKLHDAAACITISDFNLRHLRQRFGRDADRVVRVYNGIDLSRFGHRDPGPDRTARVVAVGRLVEKKGFEDLIEAAGVLASRGRRIPVDIIGDGELAAPLQARIDHLGLGDHVRMRGPLPQDAVRKAVADAAVFAAPCVLGGDGNRDGLPTVLLEAMALGTPVVSTDVTGIPEVLHDQQTGLLIAQRDPVALAGAMARLLDDADLRVRLSRAARRLIEADFDLVAQAGRVRTVITGAARHHRTQPLDAAPADSQQHAAATAPPPRVLHPTGSLP